MSKSKTIACILASGTGERFGSFPPKQFQILWNKPLYMYTLEFLISSELFTDIEITPPFNPYFDPVQNLPNRLIPSEFWDFKENTEEDFENFRDSIPFLNEIFSV